MFDLEQAIAEWRRQMIAAGIKTPVPLEELEIHLREEIERQLHKGINAQAAFDAAVKQLGHADVLRQEFKQDHLDIRLLSPIYMRAYCFLAAPLVVSMVWTFPGLGTISAWQLVSALADLLIALYIAGLPLFYRQLFIRQSRLMGAAIRVGNWFAVIWTALALLSAFGLIQIGHAVGMVGWSVYASTLATVLACANYEREQIKAQTTRLVAS